MRGGRLARWQGLWFVLFAVAFGTNVPTPLLLIYRERMTLSTTVVTAIFGVYAAGLLPALFLAGPASDRLGRRRITVPFVVLSALASGIFLLASSSVPLLFVGRFVQGAVSGVVFSVGTAWLTELIGPAAAGLAARRATVALSAGWALGPLSAGLLGQWAPAALTVPYVVHLLLMVPALLAAWVVRETLVVRAGASGPVINLGIPRGAGRAFAWFVVPAGLLVFTFPSLSVTVLPLFLQRTMAGIDVAVTGVIAGLTMVSGVLVQPLGKRLAPSRAAPLGGLLGGAGLTLSVLAETVAAWPLLLVVAVLLGAGYGLTLAAGLTAAEHLAAEEARGAITASFYAVAYVGFGVPLVVSAIATGVAFSAPLVGIALLCALLAAVLAGPGRQALGSGLDEPDRVPVL